MPRRRECCHYLNKIRCRKCSPENFCKHNIFKKECDVCDYQNWICKNIQLTMYRYLKNHRMHNTHIKYLETNITDYKEYLADQFKPGMTWDNYGTWEIDHIVPLKYNKPDLKETIKRLHYTNTQPLWKYENQSKGNRYIG